jgi:hypothetical protein
LLGLVSEYKQFRLSTCTIPFGNRKCSTLQASTWTTRIQSPAGARDLSMLHNVLTVGSFLRVKDRVVKMCTHLVPVLKMVELYLHSPHAFMAQCLNAQCGIFAQRNRLIAESQQLAVACQRPVNKSGE